MQLTREDDRFVAACGGCGATMSPAEPYCRACGRVAARGAVLDLERLDEPRPVAEHVASPTGGLRGWPVVTGITLAVALIAAVLTIANSGGGDDATPASTTLPPPAATTSERPRDPPVTLASPSPTDPPGEPPTDMAPYPLSPFGEPLPYTLAIIDEGGTAHLLDLATGVVIPRVIATGVLEGQKISDVVGGPEGPLALRGSSSRYHLVDLDDPWPREVDGAGLVAYDEETGWSWFGDCTASPCRQVRRLHGYGPPGPGFTDVELPQPTTRVIASNGVLFAEAAGSIIRIDPVTDDARVVASGSLLDARGSLLVVRSCAIDLECPVYVIDTEGVRAAVRSDLSGDDIRLAPDGLTLVSGALAPSLAPALALFDVGNARPLDVDPDVLRFVTVPFVWTPNGRWLFGATSSNTIVAVDIANGLVHRIEIPSIERTIAGLVVRRTGRV